MSRRHSAEKREVNPDPKFGDLILTKFMNAIMYDGKKSTAEQIVYGALDQVEKKSKGEPITLFCAVATGHLSDPHFGRFAPYFDRRCLRFLTPCVSSTPRRMW